MRYRPAESLVFDDDDEEEEALDLANEGSDAELSAQGHFALENP